jgi:thiol-disulfide isomerase/thioredoxin
MRSLLLSFALCAPAFALCVPRFPGDHGRVEWFDGTFEEALAAAGKARKLVFVDFFTKTCPPCRTLDQDTFNETSVMNEAKSFVCIAVDAESEAGRPLAARYGVASWPSLVFLEADGSLRDRLVGFRKGRELVREFHRIQSNLGTLGEIERKVAANPADPVARLDLVARLRSFPDERWIPEMEAARASIAKGEGYDSKSPDDRYAIARKLGACGDAEGRAAQIAAIRALDPERRSAAGRHLALDELLAHANADPSAIRTFLAEETHDSVLFDGYVVLRNRLFAGALRYEKQGLRPVAAGARAEARAAAKEAWKHCPPEQAAEFGREIAMDFAADSAELDDADRAFAADVAAKASALLPRSVDHLETLALCLRNAGRREEAAAVLRRAAEIDPTRPSIRALLEAGSR